MNIKKLFRKINNYIPVVPLVFFILCICAAVIHIIASNNVAFADLFNRYVSSAVRAGLAHLTGLLPFSLAEYLLLCIPVILVVLIVYCVRITANTDKKEDAAAAVSDESSCILDETSGTCGVDRTASSTAKSENAPEKLSSGRTYTGRIVRYITSLLSVAALLYTLFVLGFAAGYQSSRLEDKLGLDRKSVSGEELRDTALWLLGESEKELDSVTFRFASSSVMPYSLDDMNDKLNDAYAEISKEYAFIPSLRSNIKYVLLSEPMTYTHISGVYTFFTGEANLNINFPDYTLPYTAAHELSHQRGIAREDEANFMAFLVCIASDDPYIRYSGYQNLYEYVVSALYSANSDYYYEVVYSSDRRIRSEMSAYSQFFDKYRENIAADISGAVNNGYLRTQGQQDGSKSYGRVVDLAVAYYKTLGK